MVTWFEISIKIQQIFLMTSLSGEKKLTPFLSLSNFAYVSLNTVIANKVFIFFEKNLGKMAGWVYLAF